MKYKKELHKLQVELLKFQEHVIENNLQVCIVFEGRDAAGKDGIIQRFIKHLRPREARTVALGKPSDREKVTWYLKRYIAHLPVAGEITFFNRSWYNRLGVEKVMGFSTKDERVRFIEEVENFEQMLAHSNIIFFKYYLDISKTEQKERFDARREDPLKKWKMGPVDSVAQEKWEEYSKARDEMFAKTSFVYAPWYIIHTDHKKEARINGIKHFLSHVDYPNKDEKLLVCGHDIICKFDDICYEEGFIEP